jgi:hypothetical protein
MVATNAIKVDGTTKGGSDCDFVEGQKLMCVGGSCKGSVAYFVKQLPLMMKVKLEDGQVRRLMPHNVVLYEMDNQARVHTNTLATMVGMKLILHAGAQNDCDCKTFLNVCQQVAFQMFGTD